MLKLREIKPFFMLKRELNIFSIEWGPRFLQYRFRYYGWQWVVYMMMSKAEKAVSVSLL